MNPRPELQHLPAVPHGGYQSTLPAGDMLDFSANVNPGGPSPRVWAALRQVDIAQHPDPRATPLRHALAQRAGVAAEHVLVGNGSIELLYALAIAYLRPADRVLIASPTFGEYARAAAMMGAAVVYYPLWPGPDVTLDSHALLREVQQAQPRLFFLCNPNNPTGTYLPHERVAYLVEQVAAIAPHTLVVLDEAFIRFVRGADMGRSTALLAGGNVLLLRSLTKDYALTGLRVGYALAPPPVIAALESVQPPWSVNALAQAAALVALDDEAHMQHSLAALNDAKARLLDDLAQQGFAPLPSALHFFLLPVGDGQATAWARHLRQQGVLVRDATSFGLPDYLRIATRTPAENARLVAALVACRGAL